MEEKKKIYIASPLGFSEVGRYWMNHVLFPAIKALGLEIIDPWNSIYNKEFEDLNKLPPSKERNEMMSFVDLRCGQMNENSIVYADGVLAILDGQDVDSGTASEVGYASALGKPILGYRGDFRLCSDNPGTTVNLQVEYFIKKNGGLIVHDLLELSPAMYQLFVKNNEEL